MPVLAVVLAPRVSRLVRMDGDIDAIRKVLQDYENALDDLAGYLADLRYEIPTTFTEAWDWILEKGWDDFYWSMQQIIVDASDTLFEVRAVEFDFVEWLQTISPMSQEMGDAVGADIGAIGELIGNLEALAPEIMEEALFVIAIVF